MAMDGKVREDPRALCSLSHLPILSRGIPTVVNTLVSHYVSCLCCTFLVRPLMLFALVAHYLFVVFVCSRISNVVLTAVSVC